MALGAQQIYPVRRSRSLPLSPLQHIKHGFASLFRDHQMAACCLQICREGRLTTEKLMRKFVIEGEAPYVESREKFDASFKDLVAQNIRAFHEWLTLSDNAFLRYTFLDPDRLDAATPAGSQEREFTNRIWTYLNHDGNHTAPLALLKYAVMDLQECYEDIAQSRSATPKHLFIPDVAFGHFQRCAAILDEYTTYFDQMLWMPEAFFTPLSELGNTPQLSGRDLPRVVEMFASAMALRFLSALVDVHTGPISTAPHRHTLVIDFDPALSRVELPFWLLAPKLVGDVKNCIREIVRRQSTSGQPSALFSVANNRPIEDPVVIKFEGRLVTDKTWELRISDNGKGIIVEDLFVSLARAAERFPDAISPALKAAVSAWQADDPFAFNNIPYGDLLEAAFHLGVSSGSGKEDGSGIGLWGSVIYLLKLGAGIKVGVNPATGGFYESIILPMTLGTTQAEIKLASRIAWHR